MSEKISNAFHTAMGEVKEGSGKVVGNETLYAEGAAEKASAEARAASLKAEHHARGAADSATGRVKSTVGAATGDTKTEAEGYLQQANGEIRKAFN
ncbi:hypothetical protein BGX26_006257 [Mortierella sp. AD094]|nr:hypothetical protein BGX26_006257 [Mortierella sp. AD094]